MHNFPVLYIHRFRGLVDEGGDRPLRYWQSWASRLGFVIVFEVSVEGVDYI